jgi:flagellar basal-body rod modification protein FlgD
MLDFLNMIPTGPIDSATKTPESQNLPKKQLGQSEFFELMTAQLQHQDPLDPTKSDALIAQVAQFSTVDGIQEMQRSIEALSGSFQSAQALHASTLVGREVLVNTDRAVLETAEDITGAIALDAPASALAIEVTTPSGALVRKIDLGPQESGRVSFAWDGFNQAGEPAVPGQYVVKAVVEQGGETFSVPTFLRSKVESVTLNREPGMVALNLRHHDSVRLDQVVELL